RFFEAGAIMKLLIPIDFSPSTNAVIDHVTSRPWPEGTQALVFHVVDVFGIGAGLVHIAPFLEKESEDANKLAAEAAHRISACGIKVNTQVVTGHPAGSIPACAKEWGADLVLVGSHGQSGLVRFLLGSVAKAVVRNAPCSVEIVRPGPVPSVRGKGIKVLLAADGSEYSQAAAESIARRPWPKGSEFRVIAVAQTLPLASEPWAWYAQPQTLEELRETIMTAAKDALNRALAVLNEAGLNATGSVVAGDPKSCILDEAEQWAANLIVLGSHGRRGLDRLLLGSVAEAVAMHAKCSVQVVRKRAV
ncbi:MAG TPA: universal stress protein, partial [Blastocatellia bacterium]|nr:universal stress protein [Blastocatellia bacterium]